MTIPAQNFYQIEGDASPGTCQVLNLVPPHGWDEKAGVYLAGATLVPKGRPLATWTIRHFLWRATDFDDWQTWAAKYFDQDVIGQNSASNTPSGKVLNLEHPFLYHAPWNLGPCVVMAVHGYVRSPAGLYTVDVDFKQWRKPVPVPSKPSAALPPAAKTQTTAPDEFEKAQQTREAKLGNLKLKDAQTPP